MGPRDPPRGGWNGFREGQFRRRQRAVTAGRRRGVGGRNGRDRRSRGRGAGDRRRGARGRGVRCKTCAQTGGEDTRPESSEEESCEEEKEAVRLFQEAAIYGGKRPERLFWPFLFAESRLPEWDSKSLACFPT